MAFSSNVIYSHFNNTGSLLESDFRGGVVAKNVFQTEYLVHVNNAGGQYFLKSSGNSLTDTLTPHVRFASDPITYTSFVQ